MPYGSAVTKDGVKDKPTCEVTTQPPVDNVRNARPALIVATAWPEPSAATERTGPTNGIGALAAQMPPENTRVVSCEAPDCATSACTESPAIATAVALATLTFCANDNTPAI